MALTRGGKARAGSSRQANPPQHDVFPNFTKEGDVKVIVTGARQYQLHSNVLKNNSPVMRELLDSVDPAPLSNKLVKSGFNIRYKLMLVNNPDPDASPEFIFEPVPLDSNARPINGNPAGIGQDLENGKIVSPTIIAFNIVLGAFYNVPIELGDAQGDGLTLLLSQALEVTTVAEYLRCIHIITPPIESTLLATGQNLYRAIGTNPCAWLSFSYRVRSKAIFKEALIHAAGQYHNPDVQKAIDGHEMPQQVIDLLITKGNFLQTAVMTAERHLASYYPTVLMREATVGRVDRDNIGRANYANDIMMWIALSVFRHWCCDMIASDQAHHAEDMGFAFMQAIAKGGNNYLSKQILHQQFHQRFPMSPKGMACVEHRLAEIKDVVKQWAEPLMHSTAALDLKDYPVPYFTSVNVTIKDYPWLDALSARVQEEDDGDEDEEEDGNEEFDDDDIMADEPPPPSSSRSATSKTSRGGNAGMANESTPSRNRNNTIISRGTLPPRDRSSFTRQAIDLDEDMDSVSSAPTLTTGPSINMSIDHLGDGDLESDGVDVEIEDDDDGRQAAPNLLARLHRAEVVPEPPSLRARTVTESFGGDTEPELDQSYQEPFRAEARRRREEREAISSQGSQEALDEWIDQDLSRSRRVEARIAAAANVNADLRDIPRSSANSIRRGVLA